MVRLFNITINLMLCLQLSATALAHNELGNSFKIVVTAKKNPSSTSKEISSSASTSKTKQLCNGDCDRKLNRHLSKCDSKLEQEQFGSPFIQKILNMAKPAQLIKDECFRNAQIQMSEATGSFAYCSPGQSGIELQHQASCITPNYTNLVRKSFDLTFQCLKGYISHDEVIAKNNMRDLFYLMSAESGLHLNAIGRDATGKYSYAAGLGQLVGGNISHTNQGELKLIQKHLDQVNDPECKDLQEIMSKPMRTNLNNWCDRIGFDHGNPLKQIAYTMAAQKRNKRSMLSRGLKLDTYRRSTFAQLSGQELDELARQLALVAHNAGFGGVSHPLSYYLRSMVLNNTHVVSNHKSPLRDNEIRLDSFVRGIREFMRKYPHPANASRRDPSEPVNYFESIIRHKQLLNNSAGGQSCIAG